VRALVATFISGHACHEITLQMKVKQVTGPWVAVAGPLFV